MPALETLNMEVENTSPDKKFTRDDLTTRLRAQEACAAPLDAMLSAERRRKPSATRLSSR